MTRFAPYTIEEGSNGNFTLVLCHSPYTSYGSTPPHVEVTVSIPEGLAHLAEHLSPQYGLTPQQFMGALLTEALHEALQRTGRQVKEPFELPE